MNPKKANFDDTYNNTIETEIISTIKKYSPTWSTLLQYDENNFNLTKKENTEELTYLSTCEALQAISYLKSELIAKKEASELFGRAKDNQLDGILKNISQTFDGNPLYPSNHERAAQLLYFIIKDHPFYDGNKRIASLLFLLFLKKANFSLEIMENNSLVALALLIAESNPQHREIMIKLTMTLLTSSSF